MAKLLNSPKEIGRRIRALRKKQGKTQSYFADLLYISPSYLALIEAGKRTPTVEVLAQISGLCDVSVDYLLFGTPLDQYDLNEKTFQRLTDTYAPSEMRQALQLAEFYLQMKNSEEPEEEH